MPRAASSGRGPPLRSLPGYAASLKHDIDLAKREWLAKPVAFVSYGQLRAGCALVQLRQVFAELHTVTHRDTVTFHNARELFDHDGQLKSWLSTSRYLIPSRA